MVETNGTAMVLPIKSCGLLMPDLLLTTNASEPPNFTVTRKTSIGKSRLAAAARGLEPMLPITTSPEAKALTTSEPASNLRH